MTQARKARGIPAFGESRADTDVAAQLGVHRHQVAMRGIQLGMANFVSEQSSNRWTDEIVARLGKEPDADIAAELAIAATTVAGFRHRHGIRLSSLGKQSRWTPEVLARIGTAPDAQLADEIGCTTANVAPRQTANSFLPEGDWLLSWSLHLFAGEFRLRD